MKYLLIQEETERLKFRLLNESDFNDWLPLFNENIAQFLGMQAIKTPKEQCEKWFELAKNRYDNDLGGMNVLVDKISNRMVGQCGLLVQTLDDKTEIEIGYSILPEFWNKGYASEAAQKCRDYAFENNIADYLISIIHVNNVKSEKVAINNGMKIWKTTEFKEMPVNVYRITKEEWKQLINPT